MIRVVKGVIDLLGSSLSKSGVVRYSTIELRGENDQLIELPMTYAATELDNHLEPGLHVEMLLQEDPRGWALLGLKLPSGRVITHRTNSVDMDESHPALNLLGAIGYIFLGFFIVHIPYMLFKGWTLVSEADDAIAEFSGRPPKKPRLSEAEQASQEERKAKRFKRFEYALIGIVGGGALWFAGYVAYDRIIEEPKRVAAAAEYAERKKQQQATAVKEAEAARKVTATNPPPAVASAAPKTIDPALMPATGLWSGSMTCGAETGPVKMLVNEMGYRLEAGVNANVVAGGNWIFNPQAGYFQTQNSRWITHKDMNSFVPQITAQIAGNRMQLQVSNECRGTLHKG